MNFNNQLQIIEGIIQGDDVDTRVDCPFCNHTNTLTIKKSEGKVMWYCFHASCNAKGNIKKEMSMKDVEKSILLSSNADIKKKYTLLTFLLYCIDITSSQKNVGHLKHRLD